eukprot:CAMPEP_0113264876 /NCGR_PEP_ID=MMETSP0008_2-20120614/19204_1 /TAXON_ID=97485 /ORGANISM="Prymnesium parvum" /LENGTH=236 /DNA_ID=CAMNT_0000113661 /DNA_START=64 /DNA_END=772 /DNA_ORIENTATION=+ /assembly_acc=CAM_ASM_000153
MKQRASRPPDIALLQATVSEIPRLAIGAHHTRDATEGFPEAPHRSAGLASRLAAEVIRRRGVRLGRPRERDGRVDRLGHHAARRVPEDPLPREPMALVVLEAQRAAVHHVHHLQLALPRALELHKSDEPLEPVSVHMLDDLRPVVESHRAQNRALLGGGAVRGAHRDGRDGEEAVGAVDPEEHCLEELARAHAGEWSGGNAEPHRLDGRSGGRGAGAAAQEAMRGGAGRIAPRVPA